MITRVKLQWIQEIIRLAGYSEIPSPSDLHSNQIRLAKVPHIIDPDGVSSICQELPDDSDGSAFGRDVKRGPPVGHGHVGVGAGLEQHLGALLAPRFLDSSRDVERRFTDYATYKYNILLV